MAQSPLPGTRVQYHMDGSVLLTWQEGISSQVTQSAAVAEAVNGLNIAAAGLDCTGWQFDQRLMHACVIFPEVRTFRGIWAGQDLKDGSTTADWEVDTSVDTTDGRDGTWINQGTTTVQGLLGTEGRSYFRSELSTFNAAGVKAVRINNVPAGPRENSSDNKFLLHIYADILAATASDRLQFWHPTLDQPLAGSDWSLGDVERGSTGTVQFRIKNAADTEQANSIDLDVAIETDVTPSVASAIELSTDDSTYLSTINIGNLTAGSISSVLYARYALDPLTPIGYVDPYVRAIPGSWT